jgi:hypothetical protein
MMHDLLKNYNTYGNFMRDNYFVQAFAELPSARVLDLTISDIKRDADFLERLLEVEENDLELIFRLERESPGTDYDPNGELPHTVFYRGRKAELTLWISLQQERIFVEALYNHRDDELVDWIKALYQKIKLECEKEKTTYFKVLSKSGFDYYTEDIEIKELELKVDEYYNDDFREVHDIIDESLKVDSSGLILLHGAPGTGKTSYIKYLLGNHEGRDFIFIPNDFVNELLQPNFISFLITNKNATLVIEDAEKVIISRESNSHNSVVSTILQLTDGLFSDFLNIKIICTFNTSIEKVDKALLRKGRMIAYYEFKALHAARADAMLEDMGHSPRGKDMTLAEIFNLEEREFEGNSRGPSIGFKKG